MDDKIKTDVFNNHLIHDGSRPVTIDMKYTETKMIEVIIEMAGKGDIKFGNEAIKHSTQGAVKYVGDANAL